MVAFKLVFDLVDIEYIQDLVLSSGAWGPVIIVLYVVISHVFAPLVGSPVFVASAAVYGVTKATILLYIGGMISSIINFYIAKKWGRGMVEKFVGKKSMEEIDGFVSVSGTQMLILARTLGSPMFDLISYAVGLTNMNFARYYLITVMSSALVTAVQILLFGKADFTSGMFYVWLGILVIISALFIAIFKSKLVIKNRVAV